MEHSFHYLLMSNQSTVHRAIFSMLRGTGLTLGQPKVLDYLREHNGAGQKEIAIGCHVEPASVTAILNGMEEKGLIERRHLNGNRRSSYVFLTEKGKDMQSRVEQAFQMVEEQAFSQISEEKRKEFMQVFEQIYMNLSKGKKEEAMRE